MGIFSLGGDSETEYRIDHDTAVHLRIRAVLFDGITFIFSTGSIGLFAIGVEKTAALGGLALVLSAVPVIGEIAAGAITALNLASTAGLLVAGLSLSTLSSLVSMALWLSLSSSFRSHKVPVLWDRLKFALLIKIIPIPGLGIVPQFFIFTNSMIEASHKEDEERKEKTAEGALV